MDQSEIAGIYFGGCNFEGAVFARSTFIGVYLHDCKMDPVNFTDVVFKKASTAYEKSKVKESEFDGTIVAKTDFSGIEDLGHRQMSGVQYDYRYPPKNFPCRLSDDDVAGQGGSQKTARPVLPPTWDYDKQQHWSMARWEKYKASEGAVVPLDQEGNEVPIVEPEAAESADTLVGDSD